MNKRMTTVAGALGEDIGGRFLLARGGQPLLALPCAGEAAKRSLNLYQPQRGMAKRVAALLRGGARFGLHRLLLAKAHADSDCESSIGNLLSAEVDRESIGILFGSADHRVFRAVLSYCNAGHWEVGKLASGNEGAAMLDREAAAMDEIGAIVPEVPKLLGLEASGSSRLLRMPYLTGRCLAPGDVTPVRDLLGSWLSDELPAPLDSFPEWPAIEKALKQLPESAEILDRLAGLKICKSVRHGDMARWNLLRTQDGNLKVLDWEWGAMEGLSGIDLVHYLAQDFRLVRKLPAARVIGETVKALQSTYWQPYLDQSGWAGHVTELVIACLAFKQGAGHQENAEILRAALHFKVGRIRLGPP